MAKSARKPPPIGAQLRALIEDRRGPRQVAAVALELGMSRQQLHQILSGRSGSPELATVARILAAIGAGLEDLVG
jgi:DNA-binding phage protein